MINDWYLLFKVHGNREKLEKLNREYHAYIFFLALIHKLWKQQINVIFSFSTTMFIYQGREVRQRHKYAKKKETIACCENFKPNFTYLHVQFRQYPMQ